MGDHREKDAVSAAVEEMETALIRGDFRQALHLSNAYLMAERDDASGARISVQSAPVSSDCQDCRFVSLSTPIEWNFGGPQREKGGRKRRLTVDLADVIKHDDDEEVERAAAVALQSWHELAQASKSKSYRHLEPFLDLYCLDDRPMSLSLLVVFVLFCDANQHATLALNLTSEVVGHLLLGDTNQSSESAVELLEWWLTRLLPRLSSLRILKDVLRGVDSFVDQDDRIDWRPVEALSWQATNMLRLDELEALLDWTQAKLDSERLSQHSKSILDKCRLRLVEFQIQAKVRDALSVDGSARGPSGESSMQAWQSVRDKGFDALRILQAFFLRLVLAVKDPTQRKALLHRMWSKDLPMAVRFVQASAARLAVVMEDPSERGALLEQIFGNQGSQALQRVPETLTRCVKALKDPVQRKALLRQLLSTPRTSWVRLATALEAPGTATAEDRLPMVAGLAALLLLLRYRRPLVDQARHMVRAIFVEHLMEIVQAVTPGS